MIYTKMNKFGKSQAMPTESENILTQINEGIFFKEFTFQDTNFPTEKGELELADNFILLDDIIFVIQTKERSKANPDTYEDVDRWFKKKVLNDAKKQIKDSISYLKKYQNISIKNSRGHVIQIPSVENNQAKKIIIYLSNGENLSENLREKKFYISQDVGYIHLISLEDYHIICQLLVTPAEVNAYLVFREAMAKQHSTELDHQSEQYLLSHFLYNPDDFRLNGQYIDLLPRFKNDIGAFDMSNILDKFSDRIYKNEGKIPEQYYPIISEIAKLTRHELLEFKNRFDWMLNLIKANTALTLLPKRFGSPRTNCGFVFMPLSQADKESWQSLLVYNTAKFKYKHKFESCVGVTCYKTDSYFDIQWCYIKAQHEFDAILEEDIKKEKENGQYGNGENIARYYEFDAD